MKLYELYIKSHCEAPDYEDQVEARNLSEALGYFLPRVNKMVYDPATDDWYGGDWGAEDIKPHIAVLEG